jgi:Rieske Fe-S protein
MYISADEPKRSLRHHRAANGETVLILTGPRFKHGAAEAERQGFAQLEAFAAEHFGSTGAGYRWSNEDYAPRDGLPYVGWAGASGNTLLVATGFDAWGLSNGAAAARIDASRHSLKGLGTAAVNAVKVTGDLIGGHLRRLPEAGSADEGDVVKIEGKAAGVYRDEAGRLGAVSIVCPHMGCPLGWNPVDRTWDCSCHGSRFAADGRVLHGPATGPLSAIELRTSAKETDHV